MKNLNKLLVLLASAMLMVNTSCNKDDKEPVNANLTVSGGATLVVDGKDAEATVIVTAQAPVSSDVTVALAVSPANGEAVLASNEVVIPQGATSASVKITFPLSKFPQDSPEVKITVTGSSAQAGVSFTQATTDFYVSGKGGVVLPFELNITASSTNIDTRKADGVATLTFSLNKLLDEDLTINYSYDDGKTLADGDFTWNPTALVIVKQKQAITATITVPKGKEGKLPVKFALSQTVTPVDLKTEKIELTYAVSAFPSAPVKLCAVANEYRNYAVTKTFTVGDYTLSPDHTLLQDYGLDDKTGTAIANVSKGSLISLQAQNRDDGGSANKYASAMWVDWDRDGKLTDDERVFIDQWTAGAIGSLKAPYETTLNNIPENTPEGKYFARIGIYYWGNGAGDIAGFKGGCGAVETCDFIDIALNYTLTEAPLTASLVAEGGNALTVVGQMEKTVTVKLSKKMTTPVTVNLNISKTGGSGNATLKSSTLTIPANSLSASTQIVFNETDFPLGAQDSFFDVTATSSDAQINPNASKVTYTAHALGLSGTLTTYCKIGNDGYSYASIGGGSVGGVTLPAADITKYNQYIDLSQDVSKRAHIAAGSEVKIKFLNQGPQGFCENPNDPFEFVVYIDWNKDGDFGDAGERFVKNFPATVGLGKTLDLSITIPAIPANAQRISTMRIFTHYLGKATTDGCQPVESGTIYDVAYTLD